MRIGYFLFTFFTILPFIALGQVSRPEWVNGIGGGGSNSVPSGVISDSQNNIYITGTFQGTVDFDPSLAIKNLKSVGDFDIYVAKYTTTGALLWAVSMGGTGLDQEASNMAIADNGNITIGGLWDSPTMDANPGPAVFTLQNSGGLDGFIITLDKDGNFVWAKSIGAAGRDVIHKIATDKQGNVVAIGQFQSTITIGNLNLSASAGATNGLTVKFDPVGNTLWAVNLGQSGYNETRGIAVDANSEVIVSGVFSGNANFNPLGTAFTLNGGASTIFIAKYNSSGILVWANTIAGTIANNNVFVCVDASNDIYLSGPFVSPLTFNPNTSLTRLGNQDFFLAKYRADGKFSWVKGIGGVGATLYNYGIVVSKDNYLYCSGYMTGTADFNPSAGVNSLTSTAGQDFFLAKYDIDGNYKFAFNAGDGGCSSTSGRNLAIDANNDVLLVGSFCSTVNFSALACTPYPMVARSSRESFLAKYVQNVSASSISDVTIPKMTSASIDKVNLRVTITMPANTNLSSLMPSITHTGVTLSPASGIPQNFTEPVVYTVSDGCNSLNYLVTVISSNSALAAICSGSSTSLPGVLLNPAPNAYSWEMLQGNNWVLAPGVSNQRDYLTTGLTNPGNTSILVSLRRKITTQNINSYDSMYDVTIEPASVTQLTQPVVTIIDTTDSTIKFTWNEVAGATGYEISLDFGETFIDPTFIGGYESNFLKEERELTFEKLILGNKITLVVRALGPTICATSESSEPVTGTAGSTATSSSILIPNTFTPNGDGNNDILYVIHQGIKTMKWSIYTRWGNKIFETVDSNIGWDGIFNGDILPVGVYVYHFQAVIMLDESKVQKSGTITILR